MEIYSLPDLWSQPWKATHSLLYSFSSWPIYIDAYQKECECYLENGKTTDSITMWSRKKLLKKVTCLPLACIWDFTRRSHFLMVLLGKEVSWLWAENEFNFCCWKLQFKLLFSQLCRICDHFCNFINTSHPVSWQTSMELCSSRHTSHFDHWFYLGILIRLFFLKLIRLLSVYLGILIRLFSRVASMGTITFRSRLDSHTGRRF